MRPALRAVLAAALLVGAPLALGQGAVTWSLELSPASRTVAEGGTTTTELVVENLGVTPLTLELSSDPSPLGVTLAQRNVTVSGASTARVLATVTTAGLAPGNYTALFRATETSSATGPVAPAQQTATLTVNVLGQAPLQNGTGGAGGQGNATSPGNGTAPLPDADRTEGDADPVANGTLPPGGFPIGPAPTLSPDELSLSTPAGVRAPFRLEVHNPSAEPVAFNVTLRLPLGWGGTLASTVVEVPANGTAPVEGEVWPTADAPDGQGQVVVASERTGAAMALLRLARAPGGPTPPPAAEGEDDDALQGDAPGPAQTTSTPPPLPTPGVVTLRVEPDLVRVPRGGAALVHLVVSNGASGSLDALPLVLASQGFAPDDGRVSALVPTGETVRIPLVLRADEGLPIGTEGAGTAALAGLDAEPAPFRLLVAPPEQAAAESAPLQSRAAAPWTLALLAGAAGALALGAAYAWRRRWHLGLLALYARIRPGRVLEHPSRQAIAQLVAQAPGIRLADVQKRLGLANGQVRHHVDRLESAGVLRSIHAGPHRLLYPSAMGRVEPAPGLADRVALAVQERGPVTAAALAASLGVSRQALHYHVRKLEAAGRVVTRREGQDLVLAPVDARAQSGTLKPDARAADAWTRSSP